MKNFKFLYLLLAVVGVAAFTACTEEWTPGPKDTTMGVFFPEVKTYQVTAETNSIDIAVARNSYDDAATVSLRCEAKNGAGEVIDLFTVPSNVEFAAGEESAVLTVAFDGSQLVVGEAYKLSIKLDEEQATLYGIAEATFTVIIPEPWSSMGDGIYFDDFLCYLMEGGEEFSGSGAYVAFEQSDLNPNLIRAKNVYAPATLGAMWGGVPQFMTFTATGDTYVNFDITDPSNVIVGDVYTMVDDAGNELQACATPLYIKVAAGETLYDLYLWTWMDSPIVLENGIIKFPTDGSVEIAAFYEGQYAGYFSQANPNGYLQFYLPGTEFVSYDIVAEYAGMKVEIDNKTTSAIIDFAYGADVDYFFFTLVDGNITDTTAIVEAITSGAKEYEGFKIYEGKVDTYEYVVPTSNSGMKTVVAVPYSADGQAQTSNAVAYSFYFPGLGNAELPQVEVKVAVDSVVGITGNPDLEASYPSDSTMCIYMEANGEEIKSIKAFVSVGVPAEVTPEEALASSNAEDFSDFIPDMIENGYALAVYTGLTPGTTYDIFLGFTTIYGETKYFRTQYTPGAAEAAAMRLNCGKKSTRNFTQANLTLK